VIQNACTLLCLAITLVALLVFQLVCLPSMSICESVTVLHVDIRMALYK